jgi:DNA-binding response OmpR family regulator
MASFNAGGGTPARTKAVTPMTTSRPCLLLAHGDGPTRDRIARRYRRAGWDVYTAEGGAELRRLAALLEADLVLLDLALDAGGGWLTCAKLSRERPGSCVVLIGDETPRNRRLAWSVGASLVHPEAAGPTPCRAAAA